MKLKIKPPIVRAFKAACNDKGYTANMIAERCGVSESYLSRMVNGKQPMLPKYAKKIEKMIGIEAWRWGLG
jgi:transcriptional regulator with XRE-family HTH domain